MKTLLWDRARAFFQQVADELAKAERGGEALQEAGEALRQLSDKDDELVSLWANRALGGYRDIWVPLKKISRMVRLAEDVAGAQRLWQGVLDGLADSQFSYKGFKVSNPGRMSEERALELLSGIDYLIALFKKRGMEKLLRDEIKEVFFDLDYSGDAHGRYWPKGQLIELMPVALRGGSGRFMQHWIHEVFLHEFGHHIHMTYITGEARRFWDSAWDPVKDVEKARGRTIQVTLADRERFFVLLQRNNWDPVKTARKLKGLDKARMAYWLRNPAFNEGLISPKTFRPSKRGIVVFSTLRDPWGYLSQTVGNLDQRKVEHRIRAIKGNLFLDDGTVLQFSADQLKTMTERDPEIGDKAVQKIIDLIGPPTEYARTNELEDFAESWVAFLTAPHMLSPESTYRMKRTLALSALYGKEVLKIARRVAARYAQENALRF